MIILGVALLMIFLVSARSATTPRSISIATAAFLPFWLIIATTNMFIWMSAGYSSTGELPMFLLVFAVPALVAVVIWWKLSEGR